MKMNKPYIFVSLILFIAISACSSDNKENSKKQIALQNKKDSLQNKIDSLENIVKEVSEELIEVNTLLMTEKGDVKITPVSAIILKPQNFKHYISSHGQLHMQNNVIVTSEISAKIKKILVNEGTFVKKGTPIIRLDQKDFQINLNEIKANLNLAKILFEKQNKLNTANIGSEIEYLEAKTKYESMKSKYNSVESAYNKTVIKAPFSGILDVVLVNEGQSVSPAVPLFRILNSSKNYIKVSLSENYHRQIKLGKEAIVLRGNNSKDTIKGKVSFISNEITPANRSFAVNISIPKSDSKKLLLNDLFLVQILDSQKDSAIVIPKKIVQKDFEGNSFVFTLKKKNQKFYIAKKTIITIDNTFKGFSSVKTGLKANDIVVSKGTNSIQNGDLVEVKQLQ